MTVQTGRRSHRGVYRKTADIAQGAADAIGKWGLDREIQRQTACVKFGRGDTLVFYWHPVRKQFRAAGESEWTKLPPGKGIVALLLHLFDKQVLEGVPHAGAISRWEVATKDIRSKPVTAIDSGERFVRQLTAPDTMVKRFRATMDEMEAIDIESAQR